MSTSSSPMLWSADTQLLDTHKSNHLDDVWLRFSMPEECNMIQCPHRAHRLTAAPNKSNWQRPLYRDHSTNMIEGINAMLWLFCDRWRIMWCCLKSSRRAFSILVNALSVFLVFVYIVCYFWKFKIISKSKLIWNITFCYSDCWFWVREILEWLLFRN